MTIAALIPTPIFAALVAALLAVSIASALSAIWEIGRTIHDWWSSR